MSSQIHKKEEKDYENIFPKSREFYLLDKEENIKNFKKTFINDPEYIFVNTENEKKEFHENIYKRKDFQKDFEFVKVQTEKSGIYINFIISKTKFSTYFYNYKGREFRLLTEIKMRPSIMKEIFRRTGINFNTNKDIIFKEVFTIPLEQRFYNRIFMLYISDKSLIIPPNNKKQNQNQNFNFNHNNNVNNNSFNNNNFNFYTNNYNTNEKVHLKGHTGFY